MSAQKCETLGRGHFAKVKKVRKRSTGEYYAAKILDKRLEEHKEDYESMLREFKVLSSLRHKNIVALHEAFETGNSLILVCQLGASPLVICLFSPTARNALCPSVLDLALSASLW